MKFRKHYLDTQRTGVAVQISAAAHSMVATNEGERVEVVDGHAVMVLGEADPAAIERFAADTELYAERETRAAA